MNNTTDPTYNALQKEIDWHTAPDDLQLATMQKIRAYLLSVPAHFPIFSYGAGFPFRDAVDQLDTVTRRIRSFERRIKSFNAA